MNQPISLEEFVGKIPGLGLSMKPGSEKIFTVTGLADGGEEVADKISHLADQHGLIAFAPRGDEITVYRPRYQHNDDTITVVSIGLD